MRKSRINLVTRKKSSAGIAELDAGSLPSSVVIKETMSPTYCGKIVNMSMIVNGFFK